ncbi:hypothetical protein HGA91_01790 [candidate division WWE3 bacterium]|nr:hypothetical protein [candidate division WWE3 bacterium]
MLPALPEGMVIRFALQPNDPEYPELSADMEAALENLFNWDVVKLSSVVRSGSRPMLSCYVGRSDLGFPQWLYEEAVRQLGLIGRRVQLTNWLWVGHTEGCVWPSNEQFAELHQLLDGGIVREDLPLEHRWRYHVRDASRLPEWFIKAHRQQCSQGRDFSIQLHLPSIEVGQGAMLTFRGGLTEELHAILRVVEYHSRKVGLNATRTRFEIMERPGMSKIIVWELVCYGSEDLVASLRQLAEAISVAFYYDVVVVEP